MPVVLSKQPGTTVKPISLALTTRSVFDVSQMQASNLLKSKWLIVRKMIGKTKRVKC
jgi:hypothetical protein